MAADGLEVEPVEVDKMLIATAETYDIEVTLPADGRYEFRATSWDRYRHTSVWLGGGPNHPAADLPPADYYKLTKEMKDLMAMMPKMQMGKAPAHVPSYESLRSGRGSNLRSDSDAIHGGNGYVDARHGPRQDGDG